MTVLKEQAGDDFGQDGEKWSVCAKIAQDDKFSCCTINNNLYTEYGLFKTANPIEFDGITINSSGVKCYEKTK